MNSLEVEKNVLTKVVSQALNTGTQEDVCILSHTSPTGIKIYSIGADYAGCSFPQVWVTNLHSFHETMSMLEDVRHGADLALDSTATMIELFEKSSHRERFLLAFAFARGYVQGKKS